MTHPEWGPEFFSRLAKKAEDDTVVVNIPAMVGRLGIKLIATTSGVFLILISLQKIRHFGPPLSVRLLLKRGGFFIHGFDLYSKRSQ